MQGERVLQRAVSGVRAMREPCMHIYLPAPCQTLQFTPSRMHTANDVRPQTTDRIRPASEILDATHAQVVYVLHPLYYEYRFRSRILHTPGIHIACVFPLFFGVLE